MSTLMTRIDNVDKHIEKLESMGDFEELRGEKQAAMNSTVIDINKEIQALRASKATKDTKL